MIIFSLMLGGNIGAIGSNGHNFSTPKFIQNVCAER